VKSRNFSHLHRSSPAIPRPSWYNSRMAKIAEKWLLFKYINGEFTPLSKPFKTKVAADKARSKYPERERREIGVGMVRARE